MHFNIIIESGNAALVDDPFDELRRITSRVIERIEAGDTDGRVMDSNGNTVGTFEYDPDEDDEDDEDEDEDEQTYMIKRFRFQGEAEVIETGLTLEEAQEHCNRDDTRGDGWFDGYTAE